MTVLITFALMKLTWTVPRGATLKRGPCIRYPTTFRENLCWLYLTQEVGLMLYTLFLLRNYASRSDQALLEMLFDVGAQKIDGTTLDTYEIVVVAFSVTNKLHAQRNSCLKRKAMPMTYKLHLDIKSSILTSASSYFHIMTTSWSLHHCSMRLPPIMGLGQVLRGLPRRLFLDSSGGSMRGSYLDRY